MVGDFWLGPGGQRLQDLLTVGTGLPLVREGQSVTLGIEAKADEQELVPTAWRDLAARFDFN